MPAIDSDMIDQMDDRLYILPTSGDIAPASFDLFDTSDESIRDQVAEHYGVSYDDVTLSEGVLTPLNLGYCVPGYEVIIHTRTYEIVGITAGGHFLVSLHNNF